MLFFQWNPGKGINDSGTTSRKTIKLKGLPWLRNKLLQSNAAGYNIARTAHVFAKDGDVFIPMSKQGQHVASHKPWMWKAAQFSFNQAKIVYNRSSNLYARDIATGETIQLTNIRSGEAAPAQPTEVFKEAEQTPKNRRRRR